MYKFFRTSQSHPVQCADCEALIPENEKSESSTPTPSITPTSRRQTITGCIPTIIILMIVVPLSAFLGAYFGGGYFGTRTEKCLGKVSNYSPLLEDVKIEFNALQFNGSLFKKNVFRQNAGPEVDAAWESLGVDYRAAIVPSDLAPKAGLASSQVQVREKYGGGYPANVEGLHHLHCLNLLRQSLYYNYDYYHDLKKGAFVNDDGVLKAHVSHCLDILRQQLMCTVDIGVLGQVWWNRNQPTAYPDFNTKHKCRNFDAVRQWAYEHQAPEEVPDDYLEPPVRAEDIFETIP